MDLTLGALLEGVCRKERIPRDADGRILLDECACIKYIIHQMLTRRASSGAEGVLESAACSSVADDEASCLVCTVHVMGLPGYVPTHPDYPHMYGGSTTLESFGIVPFCETMRDWVGGSNEENTLI